MKRGIALLLACCLLACCLLAGCVTEKDDGKSVSFTLEVTHKDGTVKSFEVKTEAKTVAEALEAEGLIAESASDGLFDTFDGEKADFSVDESWWKLFRNGEELMVGLQDIEPAEGDVISAVYTIGF